MFKKYVVCIDNPFSLKIVKENKTNRGAIRKTREMADSAKQPQNSLGRKCVTHKEEDVWLRCEFCKFYMCPTCVTSRDHQHKPPDLVPVKTRTIEDFKQVLTRFCKEIKSTEAKIEKNSNVCDGLLKAFPSLTEECKQLRSSNEDVMNNYKEELTSRVEYLEERIKTYKKTSGQDIQIHDTESDTKNSPGLWDIPPLNMPPTNLDIIRVAMSKLAIPGFRKCKICTFCKINAESRHYFKSVVDGHTYPIDHCLSCSSVNVIYLITCDKCPKQYVGETRRTLSSRFKEHRNTGSELHADKHFREKNHSLDDMKVIAIDQNQSWEDPERRERENYWIVKLKTKIPHGLNEK